MSHLDFHPPGSFCWIELGTTDQPAAKSFYQALFGWTPADMPIGPEVFYTIFRLEGRDAAAAYTLRPDQRAHGVPPNWMLYMAVGSADDAAKRAAELGGTVLAEPFDVPNAGRMAVLKDPMGASFCVWEGQENKGTGIAQVDGTLCWADLSTPDPERAMTFYQALLGWKVGPDPKYPPGYHVIRTSGEAFAGVAPAAMRSPAAPPHWMPFFLSADVDAASATAAKLGGAVHLPPVSMGDIRMAVLGDPQGAAFSVIRPPAA